MTYPLGRLVAAPDPAATVLYDFNDRDADAERWIEAQGFTLGSPTLEGDPDAIGVTYGYRQPAFSHKIRGTKQDALLALSALSRQLLRQSTGWLMVQLDNATSPGWLRIHRSGVEALSLEQVYVDPKTGDPVVYGGVLQPDTWQIPLTLTADPFIYGERIILDSVAVRQSPDGTYPMRVVLPAIHGDAPTSLRLTLTPTQAAGTNAEWMVGCVSGKTTMADTVIDIGTGDGFTAGTGTAAPTPDADYFGGSYRAVTIGAGANFLERLTGAWPEVPAGRYKVLLRFEVDCHASDDKTYLFALGTQPTSNVLTAAYAYGLSVQTTVPQGAPLVSTEWVDLGEFTLPPGVPVLSNPVDTLPDPTSDSSFFSILIGTADQSAGAQIRLDAMKLVPVDGVTVDSAKMLKASWSGVRSNPPQDNAGVTLVGVFDGDSGAFWSTKNGDLYPSFPALAGGFPTADPAADQNLLEIMALNQGGGYFAATPTIATLDSVTTLDVSYHPLWLHLPGES